MRWLTALFLGALASGCAAKPPPVVTNPPPAKKPQQPVRQTSSLTAEDLVRLESVRDVAISPDATMVAFVKRTPRGAMDAPGAARSVIWLVSSAGGEPRRYTAPDRSSTEPRWSPDGRWLAFRSSRAGDEGSQIYRLSPQGGEPERLTEAPGGVAHFAWAPSGNAIAFVALKPKTEQERLAKAEGRDWILTDVVGTPRRLYVFRPDTSSKPTLVGDPNHHIDNFAWSPDSQQILVRANPRADVDAVMMYSGLFVADLQGGWKPLSSTAGKLGAFAWSPDGTQVAFLGASDLHDPTAGVLHIVSSQGGAANPLTPDLAGTGVALFWPRAEEIVMLANQGTRSTVLAVDPQSGKRRALLNKGPLCQQIHLDARGTTLACAGSTASHPAEVFVGPLGKPLQRRTDSNPWLKGKSLGAQEVVRWTARDGVELEGILIHPVEERQAQRYPLAVLPHGGPEGISLDGWTSSASYPTQLFANRGFAVFMPNYRGSQGRGVAFGKSDQGDLGGKEFEDVLSGIDHLVTAGFVDPNRVGMGGWSYGGYFSALAATRNSARFRAAMVGAAITNWISFTGTTEIEHENSLVHWNLWPYTHTKLAWERSPMAHLANARTATLVVHGQSDTRVPPQQALELYRGLRHVGTHTELVLYPREGHGIGERAHQLDFAERFVGFFERHVATARP